MLPDTVPPIARLAAWLGAQWERCEWCRAPLTEAAVTPRDAFCSTDCRYASLEATAW